jgi:hypothetical protein
MSKQKKLAIAYGCFALLWPLRVQSEVSESARFVSIAGDRDNHIFS